MEEGHDGLGFWIDRRYCIATTLIAAMAGQCKIVDIIGALSRSGLDMINSETIRA
jgi:hypothetical protein